jgi:hypothetical protein
MSIVTVFIVLPGCGGGEAGGGKWNGVPPSLRVTTVTPVSGTIGVYTDAPLRVVFSEAMDPTSINPTTFTVQTSGPPLGSPVTGTVSYNATNKTATFTPVNNLAAGTFYSGTITTGTKNYSGTALASNYVWTFKTGATGTADAPGAVPLGSAATFRVLAGSALTNVDIVGNRTQVNGNVGVSPGTTVNGFTELVNIVPPFKLSAGGVIADQAKADLLVAFNDIQNRSTAAISLPGQIGGLTLAPGLYVNSTTSGISGTGANAIVTLDGQGDTNAVWIFKMGSSLITDPNTKVVCTNGCKAENIYWQVGSSATLGVGSTFYGTILAQTSITMNTNAVLHGRALTLNAAISLDTNQLVP